MTNLQRQLKRICPSIEINTIWSIDPDHRDIRKDCDGMDDEDPNDWTCWQSEVLASVVIRGIVHEGNDYLGGTWMKKGQDPEKHNPDISGYEHQMTVEAYENLQNSILSVECEHDEELLLHTSGLLLDCACALLWLNTHDDKGNPRPIQYREDMRQAWLIRMRGEFDYVQPNVLDITFTYAFNSHNHNMSYDSVAIEVKRLIKYHNAVAMAFKTL